VGTSHLNRAIRAWDAANGETLPLMPGRKPAPVTPPRVVRELFSTRLICVSIATPPDAEPHGRPKLGADDRARSNDAGGTDERRAGCQREDSLLRSPQIVRDCAGGSRGFARRCCRSGRSTVRRSSDDAVVTLRSLYASRSPLYSPLRRLRSLPIEPGPARLCSGSACGQYSL
jgi:hypothetical protein